jgi:hypothetical protein
MTEEERPTYSHRRGPARPGHPHQHRAAIGVPGRREEKAAAEALAHRWREENSEAIDDANAFLARNGLWSDSRRQF